MTFLYLRDPQDFTPKLLEHVTGLVVQRDFYKHQQGCSHRLRVHARIIAGDHAIALHPLDTFDTRRDRQADLLAQILHRDTSILLQGSQDTAIQLIQSPH